MMMKEIEDFNAKVRFDIYYLERLTYDGAHAIYGNRLPEDVDERLKWELEIIQEKDLSNYFLVIQELINSVRKDSDAVIFPINCKVSGSLVAYCLGISYLDPLKYDLLFENFIYLEDRSYPSICIGIDCESGDRMKEMMNDLFGINQIPGFEIRKWDLLSKLLKVYKNIEKIHGEKLDIRKIPLDDSYCLELFRQGLTDYLGLFSVEERSYDLRYLKIKSIDDIAIFHAFYNHSYGLRDSEDFFNLQSGVFEARYDIPQMKKYLEETHGFTLYQEQMLLLSRLLGDFTREESHEILKRRSDHLKEQFIERGQENGHNPYILEKIWAKWKEIGYSLLSKSQAFDYAFLVYQIAYLRTHYPIEFQMEFAWNSEHRKRLY